MALTVNWGTKVVYSDASITDLPGHHLELRDLEASEIGMLHDDICVWQLMDQGGGAYIAQVDYVNGYTLEFVGPGPFYVTGNLNCTINPTGAHVERTRATAYVTTAIGGSGPTALDIANLVWSRVLGARDAAAQLQSIATALLGETSGAGTTHIAFTDGPTTVEADVPAAGQVGERTNVVISGV